MRSEDDDDVVVSRCFERDDGEVLLLVHKPRPYPKPEVDADPDNPPWQCLYSIHFPDGKIKRRGAVGIDGMQSLLLAIAAAASDMQDVVDATAAKRPPIRWLDSEDLGLTIHHFD